MLSGMNSGHAKLADWGLAHLPELSASAAVDLGCGCFYVQGGCKRTDWFIRHLYQPKGFFTPPYETETSLRNRLAGMYSEVNVTSVEGIGCFRCVKE